MKMHPAYATWWLAVIVTMVAGEFIGYPVWAWATIAICFVVVEGIALARKARGDTASEMMWTFRRGGGARRWVAWAVAIYIPLRFSMIVLDFVPEWVPLSVLVLGVMGWLVPHFNKLGRTG